MGATAVVSGCGECGGFGVGATASSGSVCRFANLPGFRLANFSGCWNVGGRGMGTGWGGYPRCGGAAVGRVDAGCGSLPAG